MSVTDHDLVRVRRAIELAVRGRFGVEPNPLVGCVLENAGRVVGEGWHAAYGGPHAEIEALAAAGGRATGGTAYLSLEPCSRVLKTGACTVALLEAGVRRVVYAASDPNMPEGGLEALRRAGMEIEGPVLETEAAPLLRHFRRALGRPRPWVILKWAMSADGRISPAKGKGGRISGPEAGLFTHDLRAHVDAVGVGVETVLVDDPRLTCRLEGGLPDGRPQPHRVIFDTRLRTPTAARLFEEAADAPIRIVTAKSEAAPSEGLRSRGAEILEAGAGEGGVDLAEALARLRERGIQRLLVEGGARIHGSLLRFGLADQVAVFVAPCILGGADAPPAVTGTGFDALGIAPRLRESEWRGLGDDLLLQGFLP